MTGPTTATLMAAAPHPLQDWAQRISAAPLRSIAGVGHLMLVTGAIAALCGSLVSIALIHIGTGLMALGAILTRPPIHRLPGFRIGCAFAAWVALSIVVCWIETGQKPKHLSVLHLWLLFPLGVAAFATAGARRAGAAAASLALLASAGLGSLQALIGYGLMDSPWRIDPDQPAGLRVSGFIGYILVFGSNCAVLGIALLGLSEPRKLVGIGRLTAAFGVILALARSAILGVFIGTGIWLYGLGGRARRLCIPVLLGFVAVVTALILLFHPSAQEGAVNATYDGRIPQWIIASEMTRDHPLVGQGGMRPWQDEYEARWHARYDANPPPIPEPRPQHCHNGLLILSSFYGLPAAILFLALMIRLWLTAGRTPSGWAGRAALATWLIAGCFENLQIATLGAACGWLALSLSGAWTPTPPSSPLAEEDHPHGPQ